MFQIDLHKSHRHVLAVLALCGLALTACFAQTNRSPYRFYIPKDYVGWVQVEYEVAGAPPLATKDGYRVVRFPPGGILRTSSSMESGWAKDEYFDSGGGKLSDGYQTGVINAGATGIAGTVRFWRFFVGPHADYMKYGDPNTATPTIGPIATSQ